MNFVSLKEFFKKGKTMSEQQSVHHQIIREIETQYMRLIRENDFEDRELDSHEQCLAAAAVVPEVSLYYICGILPLSVTQELLTLEQTICRRENRSSIPMKELLSELEVVAPHTAEQYRQCVTSEKMSLVRHLRQAATAYSCFFSNVSGEEQQLDLGTYRMRLPWVSITDEKTDSHLKLLNIIKILNFYSLQEQESPLARRASAIAMDLLMDAYSLFATELNTLALRESNSASRMRMQACADMFNTWLDHTEPMNSVERHRCQVDLYNRTRRLIRAFEPNAKAVAQKEALFDTCMDLDDAYAIRLRRYLVAQPIIKPARISDRLPLNAERILETHQALARDYFFRCDTENIRLTDSEKIIASFGALDEDSLLYLCGFLTDRDYDRMTDAIEALATDDYLKSSKEPIDVRRIFSYLLNKKDYALPIRKSYVSFVRQVQTAGRLVHYVCVRDASKDKWLVWDRLPNKHFVDKSDEKLFHMMPETGRRIMSLQVLAAALPEHKEIQKRLKMLALDYFKRVWNDSVNVTSHPRDPEVVERRRLITHLYEAHLPQGKILTPCLVNKVLTQTEKQLHKHLEKAIGSLDQLWIGRQGQILRQSTLTPKEAYLNGINRYFRWSDEWWDAYRNAIRER